MKKTVALFLIAAIIISSGAAFADSPSYSVGKKAADFSVTLSDGANVTLSGLLAKYDAVFLNFFFIDCIWCAREFPYLEKAYEKYADKVAVLAVSPYDRTADVAAYREENGFTFLMGTVPYNTLETAFGVQGFPTSFMIDRESVVCLQESTTLSSVTFEDIFSAYTADDYVSPTYAVKKSVRTAAEFGSPALLSGSETAFEIISHDGKNIFDSAKKVVFDVLPGEYAYLSAMHYYIIPEFSGNLTVLTGPETDVNSAQLDIMTEYSYYSFLLADLDTSDRGFTQSFSVSDDSRMIQVNLRYAGKEQEAFFIYDGYPLDDDFSSVGISFHIEDNAC